MTRFCLPLAVVLLAALAASAAEVPVEFKHRGVTIAGKATPPGVHYDIDIVPPEKGAARVRDALDVLYQGSSFNADAIEKLKAAGNVVIVYDPAFPGNELTKVTIAAFLPDFYQADGKTKDFVTVVGRFGAKWSPHDLAAVLAHELTGHGMQHLRGRLDYVREVDLECEAYLYQESAYQDLGFDKKSRDMIGFRQTLERHWCADFRRWQLKNNAPHLKSWDKLNPEVAGILDDYLGYIEALRESGTATRAVANARRSQKAKTKEQLAALAESEEVEDHFQLGLIHANGIGVEADATSGVTWFRRAAEAGHAQAQYALGQAYWRGQGTKKDPAEAARWTRKAAENGIVGAAFTYGAMLVNGDGVARDPKAGISWLRKAAAAGNASAKDALRQLGAAEKAE